MMNKRTSYFIVILIFIKIWQPNIAFCQNFIDKNNNNFDSISEYIPGLNQSVDLSVNNLPIQELIRSIAIANRINVVVDPSLKIFVTNNFVEVPAKDVFSYICNTYNLNIVTNGSILTFTKKEEKEREISDKKVNIVFDSISDLITLDLRNDSLLKVSRLITNLTGVNVLVMPDSRNTIVDMYLKSAKIDDALNMLATTNNLGIDKQKDSYVFNSLTNNLQNQGNNGRNKKLSHGIIKIKALNKNRLSIDAMDAPLLELVQMVSKESSAEYFIYSELTGSTSIYLEDATYEEFLQAVLNTTDYTYSMDHGIYLIGERQMESLRETRVCQLKYRSIKDVTTVIPQGLTKDITVFEFIELNSLILSGSKHAIAEVVDFIRLIDKVVPLITIDVIIIDNRTGFSVSTGLSAGLGNEPVSTTGEVFSGVDMTIGAESINKLINSFNGFGSVNLGNVTPNFYMSLKLMEEQGIIKVRSTPKLSTLNGHEANIIIGEKEYYVQENTDFIVNQSTSQKTTKQYKDVTAEFSLTITPYVSGDEQITMNVAVKQSTFTSRMSPDAPPGQLSRDFSSLVRVRNNEMILLGGLEVSSLNETSSGLPWISRIPIIKWLFSSRDRSTKNDKLNIFIKPTVIY